MFLVFRLTTGSNGTGSCPKKIPVFPQQYDVSLLKDSMFFQ